MLKTFWTLVFYCVLAVVDATPTSPHCAIVDGKVPLGINFALTHITAACLDTYTIPIAVARLPGSGAYAEYVADILKHEGVRFLHQGEYHIKAEGEIQITETASATLAANVSIGTIVLPHHYHETTEASLFRAAVQVGSAFDKLAWNIGYLYRMVATAYSDESCTRPRTNRPLDDGLQGFVIVVNYELDRLDIMAGEVTDMGPVHFGKKAMFGTKVNPQQVDTGNATKWADEAQFAQALSDIINEHGRTYSLADPLMDLEAVILTGEISPLAASRLSAAINIPPEHQRKIQTADAEYRGAFGAACQAYLVVKSPPAPVRVSYFDFGKDEL